MHFLRCPWPFVSRTTIPARVAACLLVAVGLAALAGPGASPAAPNILWLTSEDHGPQLGCYGDPQAVTPNVDRLAARGLRYTRVWSCAPVCAPARTTLISGLAASTTGAEQMRSLVRCPPKLAMFPQLLRAAGYYCANNAKEDYNLAKPGTVWDASSRSAHWRARAPGQPFFAVFNSEKSHESRIRARLHTLRHDPAQVRVPPYHPDTPEVRRDWAQYYDIVSEADADAGRILAELEADGLADSTIVFYFADHGSGMPRHKRTPGDSGLHVPLIVHIPEQFRHLRPPDYRDGGASERLISFVDFAPTVLSLAGIPAPTTMEGRAFLGAHQRPPPPFLHGFRGRMDERQDFVRSVTDGRFVYVRNYLPHLIPGQHVDYMFQTPTTRVWKELHDRGQLNSAQDAFWQPKPPEELYDLRSDPDEVHNLAQSPAHRTVLHRLRRAQQDHALDTRDLGFLPEGELHRRSAGTTPYDFARDARRYPLRRILAAAEAATGRRSASLATLRRHLRNPDSAIRYWGAIGILERGPSAITTLRTELQASLADDAPEVAIVAAQALARSGQPADLNRVLPLLVAWADTEKHGVFTATAALQVLDALGPAAAPVAADIARLPEAGGTPDPRYALAVPRLKAAFLERFPANQPTPATSPTRRTQLP